MILKSAKGQGISVTATVLSGSATCSSPYGRMKVFPGVTRRHSSGCGRQVNVRMPLLVTTPCVDHREYPRLHICLMADFQYHIRCNAAHLCQ